MELEKEERYNNHPVSTGLAVSFLVYQHDSKTQPIVEEGIMQTLNEHLENLVYTADGEVFDLFVKVSGGYQANDRGNILYDADGKAISDISYTLDGNDAPVVHYTTWEPTGNADPGGSYIIAPIDEDDYFNSLDSSVVSISYIMYQYDFRIQEIIDERVMQEIGEYLHGRIFTADGKPYELFVPVPGGFQADDKGNTLYDEDGREIGAIRYTRSRDGSFCGIDIESIEEVEEQTERLAFTDTYDEAVAFLGKDFRLPATLTDGFGPPTYRRNGGEDYEMVARITGRRAVYVSLDGDPGMYFFVEANRDSETDVKTWYVPDAVITEGEIAGVTVYKISDERMNRYTWTLDDLTYMFFQIMVHPNNVNCFTDEQCEDIIRSMIE